VLSKKINKKIGGLKCRLIGVAVEEGAQKLMDQNFTQCLIMPTKPNQFYPFANSLAPFQCIFSTPILSV
jgi:hypothetical protein